MKHFTNSLLHPVALLFMLMLATPAVADQRGILWQITPAQGKPSYLFATIHSEDPRVKNLPSTIQRHFNQADVFCAETMMDPVTQMVLAQGMLYLNGKRLKDQIDKPLYDKTISLVPRYGIPAQMAPMLKPWAAGVLLSLPVPETGVFLDYMLYQKAEQQGKKLCGLEAPGDVVAIFDNLSMETQAKILRTAVDEYNQLDSKLTKMHELYLAGDLTGLLEYSEQEMEGEEEVIALMVNEALMKKRNYNMLQNMQSYLKKGNAFIAVGALHLPGNTGLLQLLEQRGYRLKAIY